MEEIDINSKKNGKRTLSKGVIVLISLCGVFLIGVIAAVIILVSNPTIINGLITDALLVKLVKDKEIECDIEADISYGNFKAETAVTFWRTETDDMVSVNVAEIGEIKLYLAKGCVFLDNGYGFKLEDNGDGDEEGIYGTAINALPDLIRDYKVNSRKTSEGREYSVTITGEGAINYVYQLYPDYADKIESVDDIEISLLTKDWNITKIRLEGSAELDNGNEAELDAEIIIVPTSERGSHKIPKDVLAAMDEDVEKLTVTQDMIALAYAVGRFYSKDPNAGRITISADLSFLELGYDKIDLYRCKVDDEWYSYVTALGKSYYYNGNGSCDAEGKPLNDSQQSSVDIAHMVDVVYNIFLEKKFSAEEEDGTTVYKVELDKNDVVDITSSLSTDYVKYAGYIDTAAAIIKVEGGQVLEVSVEFTGQINILFIKKSFNAAITFEAAENPEELEYEIPDAVIEAIGK